MLMTLKHEAKRQSFPMPSPTRTHKVKDEELVYCGSNYEQQVHIKEKIKMKLF